MNLNPDESAALLAELTAARPEERAARLSAVRDAAPLIIGLIQEVERLAFTDVSKALAASELVLRLAEVLGGSGEFCRALRARAQTLAYAGRPDEALQVFRTAVTAAERAGLPRDAAQARMSSMHALCLAGSYDEAISAGRAAYDVFEKEGERLLAARVDSNLGGVFLAREDCAAALSHFERARAALATDPVAAAQIDSNRGRALLGMDRFADAEKALAEALPVFEQAQMAWAAAIVEGNLADVATRQGRLSQALLHFERTRRHLEQDAAPGELARVMAEQAEALLSLGMFADAAAQLGQVLPQLISQRLALEAAKARAALGRALLELGREAEAESTLSAAAGGLEALGQSIERARVDAVRAELLRRAGRAREAEALLRGALHTFEGRPVDAAMAHYHLARIALEEGWLDAAQREVAAALGHAEPLDLAPLLADLFHLRGLIAGRSDQAETALRDLRRAVERVERIRGSLQAERFRAAFHGNRLAVYEDLVAALLRAPTAGNVAEAFAVAEKAKSRLLLDRMQGILDDVAVDDAADGPILSQLHQRRAQASALYSRLAEGDARSEAVERRRRRVVALEDEIARLESRVSTTRRGAMLFAPPTDLSTVQSRLRPDTVVLEYFALGGQVLAFVARADEASAVTLPTDMGQVHEQVERLHFQLRRSLRPGADGGGRGRRLLDDVQRELKALYQSVLAPLMPLLEGATKLIVVPHGPLHAVPFAALYDGAYLVDRFEVTYAPSASVSVASAVADRPDAGLRTDASSSSAALRSVVVGFADAAAPLIENEARQVAASLGGAELLVGADATLARVTRHMRDAGLIHLGAHGHAAADNPMAAGVRLADGWLRLRDVYSLRLAGPLVTLSGCETGKSVVGAGDELLGLIHGFLAAGAAGLMVSLWSVDDSSTAELMSDFYGLWRYDGHGAAAATALRQAQRRLRATRPHPAHWAPFVYVGGL